MTHTIELAPEVERVLEAKAQRRGLALDAYLRELAENEAVTPPDTAAQQHAWEAFCALGTQVQAPPLSDDAVSRAGIYDEFSESRKDGDA